MNTVIAERIRSLNAEDPQGTALCIIPILGKSHEHPLYRLMEPDTLPHIRVTEVSEGGSVPTLKVENTLKTRLFLMDGQELVGAKQNRILNTDVMVPARSALDIPVSCVEAHRWHYVSPSFVPGKTASHRIRSGKQQRVQVSLKQAACYDGNQGAVWEEVEQSLCAARAESPTRALHDAYEQRKHDLDAFRVSLKLPEQAVGLAVFQQGRLLGLDLFDRHTTLRYFWDSLVDSYAIEWLGSPIDPEQASESHETEVVLQCMEQAAGADWDEFSPPGEGVDWRLSTEGLSGSALVVEDAVIHLQLFPRSAPEDLRARIRQRYTRRRPE